MTTQTTYSKWMNVVTYSKSTGNLLAAAIGEDTGDAHTFDYAVPVYPQGTTFSANPNPILGKIPSKAPVAWAIQGPIKQAAYDQAATYISGGYPSKLVAAGLTNAQIDAARAVVKVQVGDRDTMQNTLNTFIASLGLVPAQ